MDEEDFKGDCMPDKGLEEMGGFKSLEVGEALSTLFVLHKQSIKNVDKLTDEISILVKSQQTNVEIKVKQDNHERRIDRIDSIFAWTAKTIGVVLIGAILSLVIIHK